MCDVHEGECSCDVDQNNSVDMRARDWSDYYARNPDALDHGDDNDYY